MTDASKSFWSGNSCVPSWFNTLSQMWASAPPKLLETMKTTRTNTLPPGIILRTAEQGDLPALVEFWGRYFSITKSCKSAVPLSHLRKMVLERKWDILILVSGGGDLLASIVQRKLVGLRIREARWAEAGCIDYYCVHPAWRKKGLGRVLLNSVHNKTPAPIPPHLIFWENLQVSVPPLVAACFLSRKCSGTVQAIQITDPEICKKAWRDCVKGVDVWTESWGDEVSFWSAASVSATPVVVWNTFHHALGGSIGIILGSHSVAMASVNALAESKSPWGVLLLPQTSPFTQIGDSWAFDSVFQWIGYNLSVGFVSREFPVLGF
jgi:hypothetical protein